MKFQSNKSKSVFFEPWETPLSKYAQLGYIATVAYYYVHFILAMEGIKDKLVVVSLPGRSPFRLIDETNLGKLWRSMNPTDSSSPYPKTCTWKLWGTPFFNEIAEESILYIDTSEEKEKCQYLIKTQDECPEFFVAAESNIQFRFFDTYDGASVADQLLKEDIKLAEERYA
jgi:hypothetical protein